MCTNTNVEGEWNEFILKIADISDFTKIQKHMRNNFYRDEPINKLLGYSETAARDQDIMIFNILKSKLSIIALDKETKEIVGVRITQILGQYKSDYWTTTNFESEQFKLTAKWINYIENNVDICKYYGVDYYGDFVATSTDKNYRGKGLATEMYKRSIDLLNTKGFPVIKSIFTSPYTVRVAKKLGFEELHRSYLVDFKDEYGIPYMKNATVDQMACIMALRLDQN